MKNLDWTYLKENVYFWDGSWRDIYVQNISAADWVNWTEFVNNNYRIEWHNGKTEKNEPKINFDVILQFWKGEHELCSTAKIFVDDIQINAHFFTDEEIENDIDPREFKNIEDHKNLMGYIISISKLLKRPVIITPENCPEIILIKVNGQQIEITKEVDPPKWPIRIKK